MHPLTQGGATLKSIIPFALALSFSFATQAQSNDLNGRINVMECSDEEVKAYIATPDPARNVMTDYHDFERAHRQSEVKKAENDPRACFGLLYGDLSAMGAQMKSISGLFSGFSMPNLSQVLESAMDKLSKSICKRAQSARDSVADAIEDNRETLKRNAMSEINRRYGEKALNRYASDAFIAPEYQRLGLKFRNNKIQSEDFRDGLKGAWEDRLDELQDDL